MVRSLEETAHVAMILVGPDAEAAQLELDGHVLPALWQMKEMILARLILQNCRAKKDGHTDDSRKQDRNENHDEVGKRSACAAASPGSFMITHLIFPNLSKFVIFYTILLNKNTTKGKFLANLFALFKKVCYNKTQI